MRYSADVRFLPKDDFCSATPLYNVDLIGKRETLVRVLTLAPMPRRETSAHICGRSAMVRCGS